MLFVEVLRKSIASSIEVIECTSRIGSVILVFRILLSRLWTRATVPREPDARMVTPSSSLSWLLNEFWPVVAGLLEIDLSALPFTSLVKNDNALCASALQNSLMLNSLTKTTSGE